MATVAILIGMDSEAKLATAHAIGAEAAMGATEVATGARAATTPEVIV